MLHLQILQEEEHMQKMFGEEYVCYKKHWGKGKNYSVWCC